MFAPSLLDPRDSRRTLVGNLLRPRWLSPIASRWVQRAVGAACWIPAVRKAASRALIDYYAGATPPRPRPLSLAADYTSWVSLNDRSYSGRHLPPATGDSPRLPAPEAVNALFARAEFAPSTDTSLTFMFFAQWFTESFLRTDPGDPRKNTSNHDIDFAQIYGLDATRTGLLRAHEGGRLRSQLIDGKEFPPYLYEPHTPGAPLVVRPEFVGLHDPAIMARTLAVTPEERWDATFAVGLENGNSTIGQALYNVVFLREHNRIAGELAREYPGWDDDRLFETTRNIMIVLLLKVVVEEYIMHIGPFEFPIAIPDHIADTANWNRPGWISIEFDLLYRWHTMVPDTIALDDRTLHPLDSLNNNPLLIERGIESLFTACSRQRAGRFGLANTPTYLVQRMRPDIPSVTESTTTLMRGARLRSYNDYRAEFGLPRFTDFAQLTADPDLRHRLTELYGDIDHLEWFVGIWAEDYPPDNMMGELMTVMVGYDAFTQALTNPLLSRRIFTPETFSPVGWQILQDTRMRRGRSILAQIVARNTSAPAEVGFRC